MDRHIETILERLETELYSLRDYIEALTDERDAAVDDLYDCRDLLESLDE